MKFEPLFGYTKVADNTFVNLVPLLTGQFVDKFWNETISDQTYLNSIPFIWKVCTLHLGLVLDMAYRN